MKTSHKIIVILIVLILQYVWLAMPTRVGQHSYRQRERIGAAMAWLKHPSPATKAALDREEKLLAGHERKMQFLIAGACWIVDVTAIYLFLNYGKKNTAA